METPEVRPPGTGRKRKGNSTGSLRLDRLADPRPRRLRLAASGSGRGAQDAALHRQMRLIEATREANALIASGKDLGP